MLESRCREVKVKEGISEDAAVTGSTLGWEIQQEQPETRVVTVSLILCFTSQSMLHELYHPHGLVL